MDSLTANHWPIKTYHRVARPIANGVQKQPFPGTTASPGKLGLETAGLDFYPIVHLLLKIQPSLVQSYCRWPVPTLVFGACLATDPGKRLKSARGIGTYHRISLTAYARHQAI